MKHRSDDAPPVDVVVRRYGVTGLVEFGEGHEDELRRQNRLWNRLVEIDRQTEAGFYATTAEDPREIAATKPVTRCQESFEALVEDRNRQRATTRSRAVAPETEAALKAAAAELKAARKQLNGVRKLLRAEEQYKPTIEAIELARRAEVKAAVHESDVFWASAESIRQGYETARSGVLKKRGQGLPAQLRFRRFDGGGRFVNQFTGGGKTLAKFRADHIDGNLLQLTGYAEYPPGRIETTRTRNGKVETVMRRPPGGTLYDVGVTINQHREIPALDSLRVKGAKIILAENPDYHRLMPAHDRWLARDCRAVITATADHGTTTIDQPGREAVAVNLGFRLLDNGDLRVATIIGEDLQPLPIGELGVIPRDRLRLAERVEQMRSERDKLKDEIAVRLKALPWGEAPEAIQEWGSNLAKAPRFGHRSLARLVIEWQCECPDWLPGGAGQNADGGLPDDLAAFEVWRKADNKLRSNEEAARRKFLGGRLDQYRRLAKKLAEHASVILMDKVDYAQMRRKSRTKDSPLEPAARRQSQLAAMGELEAAIRNANLRYGRPDPVEDAGPSTFVCWICDHRSKPKHPELLEFKCEGCGAVHDQDLNNCRVRMRRHLATGPDMEKTPPSLAAE